ncbi:hypothetical protein [Amycolatopsis sp. lyj-23]|uniref:8-oxoguanine DNA glycosylase OGG fold protein n=1 Tax=Amycolatopsis sp. lyj-23 TaxID=2789283 RepID=UPI003979D180
MLHGALPGEPEPITVDGPRWAAALPSGAWPADFASTGKVSRSEVFALAERWRARHVSSAQFTAGVLAWGHGIRGYGPFRTGRILAQEKAAERLEAALAGLRPRALTPAVLEDCYERFTTTAKVTGLGAAFFTKLLYFAGYRRGEGGIQPLILDRVVASRLPASAGPAGKYRTGWWAGTWSAYLRWAADQAARPEFGGEPDHVEVALFTGAWTP